jgi:hypothetical protein
MNTIRIIYGIIFPILCIMLYTMLLQLNHPMWGLLFYSLGAFMAYQIWFNIVPFVRVLNS